MEIYCLPALRDNYIFLLHDQDARTAAVIDPAEPQPVLQKLRELDATLIALFNTHHHSDHVGANRQLWQQFPETVIYGGVEDKGRIPGQQVYLSEGDTVTFGGQVGQVIFVPGHTRAHIAYYFPPTDACSWGHLFCGDTLFAGGCGRLFEGTPQQMVSSLSKLRSLPDSTQIWCAHEYTLKNLQFALTVDAQNVALQERFLAVKAARRRNQSTIPSTLKLEKQTNPFLRWETAALQAVAKSTNPTQTFARIRGMKDQF